jgi:hypothetical protein
LQSFETPGPARFVCSFDASLSGFGCVVNEVTDQGLAPWGVIRERFPVSFKFDESAYQNLAEFLAIISILLVLAEGGVRECSIHIKGDSKVALKWAASQKFSGADRNNSASLLFTLLCMRYRLQIGSTEWWSSEDNHLCDTLSRGGDMESYGPPYTESGSYYQWEAGDAKSRLMSRCNPQWEEDGTFNSFLSLWHSFQEDLNRLDVSHGTPSNPPIATPSSHTALPPDPSL